MKNHLSSNRHASSGFSLIELMIALVLGLLIMAAVVQLFIGSRQTYSTNEALARVQENGRFAMEFIKPEIRGVISGRGFCAGEFTPTVHLDLSCDDSMAAVFDPAGAILGWEYEDTGDGDEFSIPENLDPDGIDDDLWGRRRGGQQLPLPSPLVDRVVPGSDVIVIRQNEILPVEIDGVQSGNRIRVTSGGDQIPAQGIMMVVNCSLGIDIFQGTRGSSGDLMKPPQNCQQGGQPGNRPPGQSPWSTEQHDESSTVIRHSTVAFYIGWNAARQEPGLYRMDMTAGLGNLVIEELVEGIENMQILYGFSRPEAAGGDGQSVDDWLTASEVPDWGLVIAVRIAMLARSQTNADPRAESFTFDLLGTQLTTPSDRRLRQPFTTTLAIRNQVLVM